MVFDPDGLIRQLKPDPEQLVQVVWIVAKPSTPLKTECERERDRESQRETEREKRR